MAATTAMRRDERRRLAAAEARAVKDDPVDLAEIRAIQEDWAALHADEALAFVLDLQPEPSQPQPS